MLLKRDIIKEFPRFTLTCYLTHSNVRRKLLPTTDNLKQAVESRISAIAHSLISCLEQSLITNNCSLSQHSQPSPIYRKSIMVRLKKKRSASKVLPVVEQPRREENSGKHPALLGPSPPPPILPPLDRSHAVLSQTTFLIVFSFTACWYITSSKNAVATQQLLHNYEILINGNHEHSPVGIVLALTALQLFIGLIMCMALLSLVSFMKRDLCSQKGSPNKTKEGIFGMIPRPEWSKSRSRLAGVGILHFLGCFCTNMGFAFGSASVVQVVKLLEPIETLLLTAIFNVVVLRTWHGITCIKTLSVLTIICGTTMLLLQKNIGQNVNYQSVMFSLLSGIFMASRNVTKKTFNKEKINEYNNKEKEWIQAAVNGMSSFCTITAVAVIPAVLFLVVVEFLGSTGMEGGITVWMLKTAGQPGKEAIIFHGLYNIASISVLSIISAQSHSLLNVGKRIFNVITASIIFHEPISSNGILGLCIAAIGGICYTCGPAYIERYHHNNTSNKSGGRGISFQYVSVTCIILLAVMHLSTGLDGFTNSIPTTIYYSQDIVSVTLPELPVPSPLPVKHVVWMFPFPPKGSHETILISTDETLICAYTNACKDYPSHSKINLRELTIGTYYHNYVRDHTYNKVRHMSEFPFHIQAITMMALLQRQSGKPDPISNTTYYIYIYRTYIYRTYIYIAKHISCCFSHTFFSFYLLFIYPSRFMCTDAWKLGNIL